MRSGTVISSVPVVANRPMFSVMIPTYNCARLLEETLSSVLDQQMSPELMEIIVVDDCSNDKPEEVVDRLGAGRVSFCRHNENMGATATFNDCILRSSGHLVHILHGDDFVLPGFYSTIADLATRFPDAGLLATRTFFIDGDGNVTGATPLLRTFFEVSQDASDFLEGTVIQFAGVVIRRKFYEQHGGFQPVLVHTADYEMWIRAISLQGGVVSPTVGAGYRIFDGNDTSKLRRSGENIFDYRRCAGFISEHFTSRQMPEYWHFVASQALQQIAFFSARGDYDAVRMSAIAFRKSISRGLMLRRFARQVRKSIRELRIGVVGR